MQACRTRKNHRLRTIMRDILDELSKGTISPEQAERIYDDVMDSGKVDFAEALSLSKMEATAFGHGVGLPELAKWRLKGWPSKCVACGRAIEVPQYGWMAKEINPDHHVLEHITCLATANGR